MRILTQKEIDNFWNHIDTMAKQSEVSQADLLNIIARFVAICSHRWRALPANTPEKKLLADAGNLLSLFKATKE